MGTMQRVAPVCSSRPLRVWSNARRVPCPWFVHPYKAHEQITSNNRGCADLADAPGSPQRAPTGRGITHTCRLMQVALATTLASSGL